MPTPPKNPSFFDKTNYVIDAWTNPCVAPWYIYVETMGPAALKAFITLISFGWDDVARGFWRPRGLNPRRTGKRKGKWRRAIPRFPELGEEIGKRIPGADAVKGRKWGCGGRTLWRIDTALQRGFFYWLVADVTNDFFFEWTSLLYKTEWCKASDLGRFSYTEAGGAPINDGVWKVFGFPTEDYEEAPPSWGVIRGNSGPTGCTAVAAADIFERPPFPPPTSFRLVIWDEDAGKPFKDFDPCEITAGSDAAACAMAQIPPNTTFQVRGWMEGTSFATIGPGIVSAVALPP